LKIWKIENLKCQIQNFDFFKIFLKNGNSKFEIWNYENLKKMKFNILKIEILNFWNFENLKFEFLKFWNLK